ncbi:MAG: trypsin-like peptidase domain-containing protein, partial [Actinomycetota bacterium]|nr:trypsin-like peptidase domain-containing protein [Actinomycetota bacterium]
MPARIAQPAPRLRHGCSWTTLTILLATALGVTGCTSGHNPAISASAPTAASTSSSLTSPKPTASALKRVTASHAVASPRTSPATPVSSVLARSSASPARPAPKHSGAGAVVAIPPSLAHPPPAQQPVPLTAASEQVGVVDVTSTLPLQNEIAAGTGMVLTSGGAILTNNHVIRGATSVTVTVVATGTVYQATVVGADPSDDIAVLQVVGAPRLAVARFGDSTTVHVGNAVVGVGNAGGVGGAPSAAPGVVTALHQAITATDANGGNPETLTDMIASNAQIQPGDSGGPLVNGAGQVIGVDTPAS